MSAPTGRVDDRADVLALDVERPALGHLARPEGRGERVRGRVAAAKAAQVDDIPRPALGRLGEVGRRALRRRPAGRPGRPGASRSRRGTRHRRRPRSRSAARASARRRAPWRIFVCVNASVGLDLVAMHERDDRDRIGAVRLVGRERRPASPRARSRRTRPTTRAGRPSRRTGSPTGSGPPRVPGRTGDVGDGAALDAERRPADESVVGSGRAAGQAGSASRVREVTPRLLHSGPVRCVGNVSSAGVDLRR